jgi:D-sedoheptulose 7-phosphate isomerase
MVAMTLRETTLAGAHALLTDHMQALPHLASAMDLLYEPALFMLTNCLAQGHKILTCGNGGSYAQAAHLAAELSVRFTNDRPPFAAICLADSVSMSAAGNDFGFDRVFARQVDALAKPGDVLVAFSTSGKSANCLEAIAAANTRGARVLGISGRQGFRSLVDLEIICPGASTGVIQEMHMILIHLLMHGIEARMQS